MRISGDSLVACVALAGAVALSINGNDIGALLFFCVGSVAWMFSR